MINSANDVIAKDPMHCSYYNTWWWNKEKSERLKLYDRILKNHSDYIFSKTVDAQEELRNYEMAKFTGESAKFEIIHSAITSCLVLHQNDFRQTQGSKKRLYDPAFANNWSCKFFCYRVCINSRNLDETAMV